MVALHLSVCGFLMIFSSCYSWVSTRQLISHFINMADSLIMEAGVRGDLVKLLGELYSLLFLDHFS